MRPDYESAEAARARCKYQRAIHQTKIHKIADLGKLLLRKGEWERMETIQKLRAIRKRLEQKFPGRSDRENGQSFRRTLAVDGKRVSIWAVSDISKNGALIQKKQVHDVKPPVNVPSEKQEKKPKIEYSSLSPPSSPRAAAVKAEILTNSVDDVAHGNVLFGQRENPHNLSLHQHPDNAQELHPHLDPNLRVEHHMMSGPFMGLSPNFFYPPAYPVFPNHSVVNHFDPLHTFGVFPDSSFPIPGQFGSLSPYSNIPSASLPGLAVPVSPPMFSRVLAPLPDPHSPVAAYAPGPRQQWILGHDPEVDGLVERYNTNYNQLPPFNFDTFNAFHNGH